MQYKLKPLICHCTWTFIYLTKVQRKDFQGFHWRGSLYLANSKSENCIKQLVILSSQTEM